LCIYTTFSIHSSVIGHLNCFQSLAIVIYHILFCLLLNDIDTFIKHQLAIIISVYLWTPSILHYWLVYLSIDMTPKTWDQKKKKLKEQDTSGDIKM
jgi:hypothetical protein